MSERVAICQVSARCGDIAVAQDAASRMAGVFLKWSRNTRDEWEGRDVDGNVLATITLDCWDLPRRAA